MARKKAAKKKVVKVKTPKVIRTNFNKELFSNLVDIRNKIADEKQVAGFIVFSDPVLKELSYYYPTTKEEFLKIKGVGENKFEAYGAEFVAAIKDFGIASSELKSRHEELYKSVEVAPKINIAERTAERKARVKELILKKMSIEDMAYDLSLTATTIVNYIGRLLVDDPTMDVNYIKESIEGYNDIVKAFKKHGDEKIGPIYAEFGGNVEYSDISLVKVLLNSK